jgi:hypothetical protein
MMDLGLVNLGWMWIFNCAVLAPFCRIAERNWVFCLKCGAATVALQALITAV